MAAEQNMKQVIMHPAKESTRTLVMTVREADNLINTARQVHGMPRTGIPVLKGQYLTGKQ